MQDALHKKWSFPLRIFSVNVTKSAGICGFGHIYWRNPSWKISFLVQWCNRDVFVFVFFCHVYFCLEFVACALLSIGWLYRFRIISVGWYCIPLVNCFKLILIDILRFGISFLSFLWKLLYSLQKTLEWNQFSKISL